ncbi:dehydrogenase/reductase SDR family member 11-like [Daktulosphaira vitifoliae]|uniref:dehydrogenase/reductase SDR family member 11-like n=1 Tax=Daktulosphaira vitifoliae TaxID=58002 RepID=UPI0021AA0C83|nr:dehydrogenase/reductase SDR family member 11-like [Daktulosphaira vitifoliae]
MEQWSGKIAVVTGASTGIGAEICKKLVASGMIVIGLARRENKLKELAVTLKGESGEFHYFRVDLCQEENILEAFKWIKQTFKCIDVLVNNAGVAKNADLLKGDTADWKLMFDTNVIGMSICTKEAVRVMKECSIEKGHIININSLLGHIQAPEFLSNIAMYGATKFSVTAITGNLRQLIGKEKLPIRVTSISPGVVDTDMPKAAHVPVPGGLLKGEDIADALLYVLGAPQHVNVAELILLPSENKIK